MTSLVVVGVAGDPTPEFTIEQNELGADVDIQYAVYDDNQDALVAACRAADCILTAYAPFTADIIGQLANCRVISVSATGYECIDIEAAKAAGISVCAIDEYCTDEVADHTVMLMLALTRRLTEYHAQVQEQGQWMYDSLTGLKRLRGQTLGVIGFGRIGRAVARRATSFGVQVLAHDPFVTETVSKQDDVMLVDLETLMASADIISLHCNLTTDNAGLINAATIKKMRKRPILINVARGGLIDEDDLVAALDDGTISGAGLDVLAEEPPELAASNLRGRSNVILTPHVAFYSDASMRENRLTAVRNIRNCLNGNHDAVRRYIHQAAAS